MKLKLAFAFLLVLIVLPLFSAQYVVGSTNQALGKFKVGEIVNLSMSCTNATQGILEFVILPDSSHDIINAVMTRNGNLFTYEYNNTEMIGNYAYFGNCNGVGWNTNFYIDLTGKDYNPGISIIFLSIFVILSSIFLVKLPKQQLPTGRNWLRDLPKYILCGLAESKFVWGYFLFLIILFIIKYSFYIFLLTELIIFINITITIAFLCLPLILIHLFGVLYAIVEKKLEELAKNTW